MVFKIKKVCGAKTSKIRNLKTQGDSVGFADFRTTLKRLGSSKTHIVFNLQTKPDECAAKSNRNIVRQSVKDEIRMEDRKGAVLQER